MGMRTEFLQEVLQKTISTNPDLGQAFGGYLPQVDVVGRIGYEDTNSP